MEIIYIIFKVIDVPHLTTTRYIDYYHETISRNVLENIPYGGEHATENDALMELTTNPYFKENTGDYIIQKIYRIKEK